MVDLGSLVSSGKNLPILLTTSLTSVEKKPAGALSGGERLRAALACALMATRPPQLIILDEPTNHLDLDSIAAVEAALLAYDGALLVVSHDRDFLAAVGVERELKLGG